MNKIDILEEIIDGINNDDILNPIQKDGTKKYYIELNRLCYETAGIHFIELTFNKKIIFIKQFNAINDVDPEIEFNENYIFIEIMRNLLLIGLPAWKTMTEERHNRMYNPF